MPLITALLHTENDAPRLGRCLETLYPCDNIVVIDHASCDQTSVLAREYGARVVSAVHGAPPPHYLRSIPSAWILCLDPHESLSESLAASLYAWKSVREPSAAAYSVFLREETEKGWIEIPTARTRLVPLSWNQWRQGLPVEAPSAIALEGPLLRFALP
jgi:glycosyltransferase involved in cell wall biosynthesis